MAPIVRTYVPVKSVRTNLTIKLQVIRELMNLRKTSDIRHFLGFDRVDDIVSHDDDEDDSSDVETDCNGYEQDYAYAKDDLADDELLELFEMITNDEDGYSDEEDMVNALMT